MSPQEATIAAHELIGENLAAAAREILEFHETSILKDGFVRQAAELLNFAGHHKLTLAEQIVSKMCMKFAIEHGLKPEAELNELDQPAP